MTIVGYDDSKQLYKVRNSWGAGWGFQGYMFVKYSDMHNPKIYEDFAVIQLLK
jgi:C1A family cysteine protease